MKLRNLMFFFIYIYVCVFSLKSLIEVFPRVRFFCAAYVEMFSLYTINIVFI